MKAREIVSYIHKGMNEQHRKKDKEENKKQKADVVCHASILKDWSRNDAFHPEHFHALGGAMRIAYNDEIKGFHDLTFRKKDFCSISKKLKRMKKKMFIFPLILFGTLKGRRKISDI